MSKEYPCVYYYDNGKCKKFEEPGYTSWCVLGPCSHETPSNADRIRVMSDEELLQFILSINNDGWPFACQHKSECNLGAPSLTACNECFAQWLQQPAKEDTP